MALLTLKVKCIKCGYGIPLSSHEYKSFADVKCPRCASICKISRDEEEALVEECLQE